MKKMKNQDKNWVTLFEKSYILKMCVEIYKELLKLSNAEINNPITKQAQESVNVTVQPLWQLLENQTGRKWFCCSAGGHRHQRRGFHMHRRYRGPELCVCNQMNGEANVTHTNNGTAKSLKNQGILAPRYMQHA